MVLFHVTMKKPEVTAFNKHTFLSISIHAPHDDKLTSYCQFFNYLLAVFAIEDNISKAHMDITNFDHPAFQSAVEYAHALWTKAVCCTPVNGEYRLKEAMFERPRKSTQQIIWSNVGWKQVSSATKARMLRTFPGSFTFVQCYTGIMTIRRTETDNRSEHSCSKYHEFLSLPQALRAWLTLWTKGHSRCSRCW